MPTFTTHTAPPQQKITTRPPPYLIRHHRRCHCRAILSFSKKEEVDEEEKSSPKLGTRPLWLQGSPALVFIIPHLKVVVTTSVVSDIDRLHCWYYLLLIALIEYNQQHNRGFERLDRWYYWCNDQSPFLKKITTEMRFRCFSENHGCSHFSKSWQLKHIQYVVVPSLP